MKTSEFIRAAVDTCLIPNAREYVYSGERNNSPYLCVALAYYNDLNDWKYEEQRRKARIVIDELVTGISPLHTNIFSAGHAAGIVSRDEYHRLEKSGDSQQIRFMLAEFIALSFEDLGD